MACLMLAVAADEEGMRLGVEAGGGFRHHPAPLPGANAIISSCAGSGALPRMSAARAPRIRRLDDALAVESVWQWSTTPKIVKVPDQVAWGGGLHAALSR